MDKLKNILHPGHRTDEETLYGTGAHPTTGATTAPGHSVESSQPLHTNEQGHKDTGLARQILNPGNDKYDETRYGDTATAGPHGTAASQTPVGDQALHSGEKAHKDSGLMRQILNPNNDKYDDTRYGDTATTRPTGAAGTETGRGNLSRALPTDDGASVASIKSGVPGYTPHSRLADTTKTDPAYSRDLARDTGLGAGTSGAALAAAEGHRRHEQPGYGETQGTDRSFPLSGGAATSTTGPHTSNLENKLDPRVDSDRDGSRTVGTGTGTGINTGTGTTTGYGASGPHSSNLENKLDPSVDSDRDGSRTLGTGATGTTATGSTSRGIPSTSNVTPEALAAAAAATVFHHEHGGHGHNYEGDPCPPGDHTHSDGTIHTRGPHITDTANRLDPHVGRSGSYHDIPTATGTGIHVVDPSTTTGTTGTSGLTGTTGTGTSGLTGTSGTGTSGLHGTSGTGTSGLHGTSGTGTSGLTGTSGTTDPTAREHHHGRDAALAGGAGAAGLGAYEAGKHHGTSGSTDPTTAYNQYEQEHGHRAGPKETDPATKTHGPHKSNILNILDPRVRPDPDKMREKDTAGPHRSNMLNKADPNVDSDLSKERTGDHHYGRDAALAGGAGAAGLGAYEATKDRHEPTTSGVTGTTGTTGPTGTNRGLSSFDPDDTRGHHTGRDTALAGGAGAAGAGAYEAAKDRPHGTATSNTGPGGVGRDYSSPTSGTTGTGYGTQRGVAPTDRDQHYGRDAALAGGAGAAGVGAYEAAKHHDQPATTTGTTGSRLGNVTDPNVDHDKDMVGGYDPKVKRTQDEHHYGRDAAVAGGAGAAGAGAYEAAKHRDTGVGEAARTGDPRAYETAGRPSNLTGTTAGGYDAEHNPEEFTALGAVAATDADKNRLVDRFEHDPSLEHERKQREQYLEKEHNIGPQHMTGTNYDAERNPAEFTALGAAGATDRDKHQLQDRFERDPALSHERDQRRKSIAKEHKDHKDHGRHETEEKEKKPGLVSRLLHRNKDKDSKDVEHQSDRNKHEMEAGGVGAAIAGTEADRHHHGPTTERDPLTERNKLHKDPPPGYLEEKARQQGLSPTGTGVGATGTTGTTGTGLGETGEPPIGTGQDKTVLDPRTGLPVNVGKYGDGHGGTDANPTVHGFNEPGALRPDESDRTNWDAVKKENTPY